MCFKEAPERIRFLMKESDFDKNFYEKKSQLQFFTPLETEQTKTFKKAGELLKIFNDFTMDIMNKWHFT